ncbi:melanoma-derived growth regulatory protein-like isoform X1 [Leucoraja erinacea]|uniref:melanoma-derived growth regulatory protein-like isoform X1 n=1 Tax=Leucoraja erinaceus TaxID=7782 RepID=UPI002458C95D|nr:melanoma-derived growth regulatory protein-like isoform X1 [Leucoraja erinacea]
MLPPRNKTQPGTSLTVLLLCVLIVCTSGVLSSREQAVHKLADRKMCADEECSHPISMGRALADYTAPDCRFINIHQGQIVYVYGKLKGRGRNFWQGTVQGDYFGEQTSVLGFFPKSVVEVTQHLVTDLIELPTEDWDFRC